MDTNHIQYNILPEPNIFEIVDVGLFVYEEVDDKKVPAVKYSFGILTPKKNMFLGSLKFKKSDEAKYKPLVDKIIASCKEK